jgi:hypothetical protein
MTRKNFLLPGIRINLPENTRNNEPVPKTEVLGKPLIIPIKLIIFILICSFPLIKVFFSFLHPFSLHCRDISYHSKAKRAFS